MKRKSKKAKKFPERATAAINDRSVLCFQATMMVIVPPIAVRMSKDPNLQKYDLSSVKRLSAGSAPVAENVMRTLVKKLSLSMVGVGRQFSSINLF